MCKSKMATNASEPSTRSPRSSRAAAQSTAATSVPPTPRSSSSVVNSAAAGTKSNFRSSSSSNPLSTSSASTSSNITAGETVVYSTTVSYNKDSSSKASHSASLSSLRESLPETPNIYKFSEICTATNNFLAKKFSTGTAASWRCTLRGKDVIVFQRKLRRAISSSELIQYLSEIYRSHHVSIIKLLGASISGDNHIYLVYQFVDSANLAACLRNPRNPNFTVLSTWLSRMQIAADLAHGMDYIHNNTGLTNTNLVHNHIKSSSIIVTEPSFNARICHFGTALLCGEAEERCLDDQSSSKGKKAAADMQFEGVRGYMSPEFQSSGVATQKSDVYAVGVVILELLTGEEPLKYKYDKESGEFRRTSIIETATEAMGVNGEAGDGRVRTWIDKRLKDSFPVEVAERVTRIALECVHVDPDKRPNMRRVAGKISKLFLESERWSRKYKMPTDISVSLVPR